MPSDQQKIYSFPPILGPQPRVLILGSMPGLASLKAQQYYAHPRNAFWPILAASVGFAADSAYEQRCRQLLAARIAVWDVLKTCVRRGSLDSAIELPSEQANDFSAFFRTESLLAILFNGAKAEASFKRHVGKTAPAHLHYQRLPSTSPAHAAMSFEDKQRRWQSILQQHQR